MLPWPTEKENSEGYFNRTITPKKSRAKNNTNSILEFVLFPYGAEDEIRTRATFTVLLP